MSRWTTPVISSSPTRGTTGSRRSHRHARRHDASHPLRWKHPRDLTNDRRYEDLNGDGGLEALVPWIVDQPAGAGTYPNL
nr:hypothetical protein [Methanosphaerula palustris]